MTGENCGGKRSRNQRLWKTHLNALKRSGLSRAEYCRQHVLSYHTMTYWWKKLANKNSRQETTLVPVTLSPASGQAPWQQHHVPLKILLPGKLSIEVGDNFSSATLTRLLAALEGR
jgi:hypothetical protein